MRFIFFSNLDTLNYYFSHGDQIAVLMIVISAETCRTKQ